MPIKKLPLLTAIAAVLAAPAVMAQSNVTIYGKLYPYIINDDGSGATAVGTPVSTLAGALGADNVSRDTSMVAGNSRFGMRGREDLGGGMSAFFQMESVVSVNNGAGGSGTQFWNRDTFVGLEQKGMGTLKLGLMDTIFKNYGDTIGILGISSGTFMSTSNILRKPGFGSSSAARFHERRANSIQLETAEFSGFQAGLQYSLDSAKTATRNLTTTSMGLKYDNGPLYVALAHEIHNDFFGGSAQAPAALSNAAVQTVNSKDKATQFTVEYRLGKVHKFALDVIQKEYKENPVAAAAAKFGSYKNTAMQLSMENTWTDQWRTAANYVRSNAGSCTLVATAATPCSTDGLAASKITVAAGYSLSKRTMGFASVAKLTNGKSSRFSTTEAGAAPTPRPGEDLTQMAIGLSHSF